MSKYKEMILAILSKTEIKEHNKDSLVVFGGKHKGD